MSKIKGAVISPDHLCIGMYVYIDMRWFEHPFAFNHFKIKSEDQIATIRSLGLKSLRFSPELSDALPVVSDGVSPASNASPVTASDPAVPMATAAPAQGFAGHVGAKPPVPKFHRRQAHPADGDAIAQFRVA